VARATLLASLVLGLLSCAHQDELPKVAVGKKVPRSSSPPEIEKVRDLGAVQLAEGQPIPGDKGDGVAVVGELVLLTGAGFGLRPKVTVSGMVAEQVARTEEGGLVVRVPWGIRTGPQRFRVENPDGTSAVTFPVRRYALASVPSRDRVFVLEVSREQVQRFGEPLELENPGHIRYCGDGQTAYVAGRSEANERRAGSGVSSSGDRGLTVAVVDMVAPGGPRITATQPLPGEQLVALTGADRIPVAMALSDTHMLVLDTRDPQKPRRYEPRPLPAGLAGEVLTAEMNPEGSLLAVLPRRGNDVVLYSVSGPEVELKELARTKVIPRTRTTLPLLRDLRFSADSSTLWVVSGENARSRGRGRFPLRLTALKIQLERKGSSTRFGVLSVWRGLDVPHQAAPVALAVARGQPTARGTTVSVPPAKAAVFITAHDAKLLRLRRTRLDRTRGLRRAVRILKGINPLGTLIKTDIEGRGGPEFSSPSLLGPLEITSDSQVLLVAGARVEAKGKPAPELRLVYGVTAYRVFGKKEPTFIQLAEVDPETLKRPFLLGDIRVQP
jgi:hypothetical protein